MKNSFSSAENLKLTNHAAFKLPDLNVFEASEKTAEIFDKISKADFSEVNFYNKNYSQKNTKNNFSHKNSIEKRGEKEESTFNNYSLPSIHLVTNNSIILETKDKIYLINFEFSKITILLNKKTNNNEIKIIYTFDENVTLSSTHKSFTRTYVFCLDNHRKLHYFYLEDNYVNLKDKKIILHKMPYAGSEITDMAIVCMKHQSENGKYFFFLFLNKTSVKFFITDYYENDLGLILTSLNFKKEMKLENPNAVSSSNAIYNKNINANNNFEDNYNINFTNNNKNNKKQNTNNLNSIYENNSSSNISNQDDNNQKSVIDSTKQNTTLPKTNNNLKANIQSEKEQDKSLKNRVKSILMKNSNKMSLKGKRNSVLDFGNLEIALEPEAEIKRIFINEQKEYIFVSFLSEFNLYTVKFQNDISPRLLAEKFKFINLIKNADHVNILNRLSKIFGLNRNFSVEMLMKEAKEVNEFDAVINTSILNKYEAESII